MAADNIEGAGENAKGKMAAIVFAMMTGVVVAQVKTPIVLAVGCAATTAEPHIWTLTSATVAAPSVTPGISAAEKQALPKRSLGRETYQLIGVAEFVDVETARRIGDRGRILAPDRVNATGMLTNGSKVAVKGLYIEARPPRINLTSVERISGTCP